MTSSNNNIDNDNAKEMLKTFYAIYDLSEIQNELKEKGDGITSGSTSLINQYTNSNLVNQNVDSPPIGGLRAKCYKSTDGLSYKTLMALNRWRHAQQDVLLPDPASIDDLDSGAESETGFELWNRRMNEILHTKKSKLRTNSRPSKFAIENNLSLDVQTPVNKSQDFDLFSPEINNLSFESVQSMPPVKFSKNNNNIKQKNTLNGKKFNAMSKLNKEFVHDFNQSDNSDVFPTNRNNFDTDESISPYRRNSAIPLSVSTPDIFKSIENFSALKNRKNFLTKPIDSPSPINKLSEKSTSKQKKSFVTVFKIPTPILTNSNNKQHKNQKLPITPVAKSEHSFLRRSPRIKLLESKLLKK